MKATRQWHLIDAQNQTLGRLATKIADLLRGKSKVNFTPAQDIGDYVVVINSEKVTVTGSKPEQKIYENYTGYPGGHRLATFKYVQQTKPTRIITEAVKGMLPKNKLRDQMLKRLRVVKGEQHEYESQLK